MKGHSDESALPPCVESRRDIESRSWKPVAVSTDHVNDPGLFGIKNTAIRGHFDSRCGVDALNKALCLKAGGQFGFSPEIGGDNGAQHHHGRGDGRNE